MAWIRNKGPITMRFALDAQPEQPTIDDAREWLDSLPWTNADEAALDEWEASRRERWAEQDEINFDDAEIVTPRNNGSEGRL